MILITGATGTTGRDIVGELHRLGAKGVRALVRDPARADFIREAGFEAVAGDFEQPETLGSALEGVERALLLTPPSMQTFEQQRAFIEAAARAGVRHVVKFSALGADAGAPEGFGKWHGQGEELLKASGLAWTILRPNFFMQNLLGQAKQIASDGVIAQAAGDGRASFIDTRDIAAVAARTLTEEGHEGRTYTLTGPEALSYTDVAAKLSEATGREIKYISVAPAQFREMVLALGFPEWFVAALERLNEVFTSGEAAVLTDDVRRIGRKEPNTFERFARDYADAFKGE
ncbi:MAG: SDR family oxidoreductase [Pyrinomonadaceae bacterium]